MLVLDFYDTIEILHWLIRFVRITYFSEFAGAVFYSWDSFLYISSNNFMHAYVLKIQSFKKWKFGFKLPETLKKCDK